MDQSIICGISWGIDHRLSALTVQVGHTPHVAAASTWKPMEKPREEIWINSDLHQEKNHGFHHSIIPSFHDIWISNHFLDGKTIPRASHQGSPLLTISAWNRLVDLGRIRCLLRTSESRSTRWRPSFHPILPRVCVGLGMYKNINWRFFQIPFSAKKNPESKYYFCESFTNPMFILRRSLILKCSIYRYLQGLMLKPGGLGN